MQLQGRAAAKELHKGRAKSWRSFEISATGHYASLGPFRRGASTP